MMPTDPARLRLEQVSYRYRGVAAVIDGLDLTLSGGTCHALVGRSGCGKSTLLKLAAGLLTPTSGRVLLDGRPVDGPQPSIGIGFQTPALLEWYSNLDNVLLPVAMARRVQAADRAEALRLLELLGVAALAGRWPLQCSGGQRSRVALARALIQRPALLLLDEPFAALDALTREALQDSVRRLQVEQDMTLLVVTHDIAEAVYLGNSVSVLENGRLEPVFATAALPADRDAAVFARRCRQVRARLAQETVP